MSSFDKLFAVMRAFHVQGKHVVHVGAHAGQKNEFFRKGMFSHRTLVEPLPFMARRLRDDHHYKDVTVVEAACSDEPGRGVLYEIDPSDMSTMVKPGPDDRVKRSFDVDVTTVADIARDAEIPPNVIVIDVQGYEMRVVEGCPTSGVDMYIVEATSFHDPVIASDYGDVLDLMEERGFTEVDRWSRSYDEENKWARGEDQPYHDGWIRDLVFVRDDKVARVERNND